MKRNVVLLSLLLLLFTCVLFYAIIKLISKDKLNDLRTLVVEKAKSSINAISPYINKDILNLDDINLLSNIEHIAKTENITSCFILDETCKVIIHNNVNEWNTEKNIDIYNNAIKRKTESLQQNHDKKSFLFSKPLLDNYTLFCTINIQDVQENLKYWKTKYYAIALFSAFLITIVFYFFSKLLILDPLNKIKMILESQAFESITDGKYKYDEITDAFINERNKTAKKIEILKENNKSLNKIIEFLQKTSISNNEALIILDSLNEIVCAYDNTGNILKKNYRKGCHIFEVAKNSTLIEIITEAHENQGKEIKEHMENYSVVATSIDDDNKIAGTIIKIQSQKH